MFKVRNGLAICLLFTDGKQDPLQNLICLSEIYTMRKINTQQQLQNSKLKCEQNYLTILRNVSVKLKYIIHSNKQHNYAYIDIISLLSNIAIS